jgi:hypothetical protein
MEALKIGSFRSDYVTLAKRLLALNGFSKDHSYNPHNVKAYLIHNEYGVICCAIGSHVAEALDNAVNNDCLDSCLITDEAYMNEDTVYLGNGSEPFDLDYIGIYKEIMQYD